MNVELTRPQKWALAAGLLLVVYTAIGFWILPHIVRSEAEQALREMLGREVAIERVRFNPYALSASVEGFELPDADGSRFVEFEELYVNFQLSSLFRRAFTFGEVRLSEPVVHVKIMHDGNPNFADLLDRLAADEPAQPAEESDDALPALLVFLAKISGGKVIFSDYSLPTDFEHEISPLDVEVRDFGTRPDDESPHSFSATTGAGEKLEWEGRLSIVPFYGSGQVRLTGLRPRTGWLYIQDTVVFEIVDGAVDVAGRYSIDARDGFTGSLEEGTIRVRDFAIAERATGERVIDLPQLDIDGISIAYPEQNVRIASVNSRGAQLRLQRLADGRFRAEMLAEADGSPAVTDSPAAPSATAAEVADPQTSEAAELPWEVALDEIALDEYRIEFRDLSTTPPAEIALAPITLRVRGVSTNLSSAIGVDLAVGVGEKGAVKVAGDVVIAPLAAELDVTVSDLDLTPTRPYVADIATVGLESGRFGLEGHVVVKSESESEPFVHYTGSVRLDDLRTLDSAANEPLLAWSALALEGLDVTLEPTALHLEKLSLRDPAVRAVLRRDGALNVTALLREPAAQDAADQPPSAEVPGEAIETPAVTVEVFELVGGAASFADYSIEPNFQMGLHELSVRVTGISSTDPDAKTTLEFSGKIDESMLLQAEGEFSPNAERSSGDLNLDLENFRLEPFTPYSGQYVGREVERGSLSLDLDYEIVDDQLTAQNEVHIERFDFGDSVESEDAIDLPIAFAVELLKDPAGQIDFDLPLTGSVDDPEFSLLRLIAGALGNLVIKAAASPFTLIAGLAGGDAEELKYVAFTPGSVELDDLQREKLDTLATALAERPGLSLGVAGQAALEADGLALRAAALDRKLRQARFDELSASWFGDKPASVDEVKLAAEDRDRLLADAYEEKFGGPLEDLSEVAGGDASTAGNDDSARRAEMERRMREAMPIAEDALRELAIARATSIRDRLVAEAGLAPERVKLLEAVLAPGSDAQALHTALSLSAL